jgi:hypothetical protein
LQNFDVKLHRSVDVIMIGEKLENVDEALELKLRLYGGHFQQNVDKAGQLNAQKCFAPPKYQGLRISVAYIGQSYVRIRLEPHVDKAG